MQRGQFAIPEVVVAVSGALDGPTLDRWKRLIDDALALHPARLVVDLGGCPRIDAAAIVVLLQVHRKLICADAQLVLRDPVPRVERMLKLSHVDRVFDIEPANERRLSFAHEVGPGRYRTCDAGLCQ
jgi:anti-anti-sigma factor